MQFKIRFSIRDFADEGLADVKELCSIEETIWSLEISFDSTSDKSCVKIIRSRDNGEVKIDVRMTNEGSDLLLINGFCLLDGVNEAAFTLDEDVWSTEFTGYVTVHYSLTSSQTSKVEVTTQTENGISSIAEKTIPSPKLVNDLLCILDNPDSFSDATLVCGSSKIPVHRNILSARSPVFAEMFKTQMQEESEGVVDIVDMEPDVLLAMLKYVYSGNTDLLTSSVAGYLLFAADKYKLEELKLICVEELKVSMVANNVFRSLVLGDLHDKSLKANAVEFICEYKNFSDLEKAEEWQSLLKELPSLALEVTTTVVKHVQEKLSFCQELKAMN